MAATWGFHLQCVSLFVGENIIKALKFARHRFLPSQEWLARRWLASPP